MLPFNVCQRKMMLLSTEYENGRIHIGSTERDLVAIAHHRVSSFNKKAVLSQDTWAESVHLYKSSVNSVNRKRNKSKTIGKHGEVVEKPLYKSISEGLMHVAAYSITGPPNQSSRNSGSKFRLARPLTRPNSVTLRQKVCEISLVEKLCSSEK